MLIKSHAELHSKSDASLSYMEPSLKKKEKRTVFLQGEVKLLKLALTFTPTFLGDPLRKITRSLKTGSRKQAWFRQKMKLFML